MADYPQTGSLLTRNNAPLDDTGTGLESTSGSGNNRTGMSLSTMIVIQVGQQPIGAIQDLSITETRAIKKIGKSERTGS